MNFEQFTLKAQQSVQRAQQIAMSMGHGSIDGLHLLKGILEEDDRILPFILKKFNATLEAVNNSVQLELQKLPKVSGGEINLSRNATDMLQRASAEARSMKDDFVTVEHLLLGMMDTKDASAQLLKDRGVNSKDLKALLLDMRKGQRATSSTQEQTFQSLEKYAKNLNKLAQDGKLDPVIGREFFHNEFQQPTRSFLRARLVLPAP